jgi:DNA invertase Pin-like site-specific DNA recombinase
VKLAGYVRVSTADQAANGFGLTVQKRAIRAWAKANGHRVVLMAQDAGVSGSNGIDRRVGLLEALDAIRGHEVDGLVIYNLDRLARLLHVQEGALGQVWEAGGKVFSVEDHGEILQDDANDPMRTAMRQMRGVFAQLERGLIRQRMAKGKEAKAERNGYTGGAPRFGFEARDRELVPNEDEQKIIARITDLHRAGGSTRSIAAILNGEGSTAKRGRPWNHVQVWQVLQRN